jgi:threonine/homoserine/homoserine lactone efflux protein
VVSLGHVVAFTVASFLLIVIPGPSVVFTIGRALAAGRRDALLTVAGDAAGVYLQVIAVAFGVGTLVQHSIAAFTVIKFAGAAYLVYLGIQGLRHRHSMTEALSREAVPARAGRALADGFIVGAANPKSVVFLVALLPQFADRHAGDLQVQLLILGAIFSVVAWACTSAWAVIAGTARGWLARSPRRLAAIGGTGGLVMIGLGIGIAATGRPE